MIPAPSLALERLPIGFCAIGRRFDIIANCAHSEPSSAQCGALSTEQCPSFAPGPSAFCPIFAAVAQELWWPKVANGEYRQTESGSMTTIGARIETASIRVDRCGLTWPAARNRCAKAAWQYRQLKRAPPCLQIGPATGEKLPQAWVGRVSGWHLQRFAALEDQALRAVSQPKR